MADPEVDPDLEALAITGFMSHLLKDLEPVVQREVLSKVVDDCRNRLDVLQDVAERETDERRDAD